MHALFAELILFFGLGRPPAGTEPDTVVIAAQYSIEFTQVPIFHGFLASFFGKVAQLLAIAPSELEYREAIFGPPTGGHFEITLTDQTGRQWLKVFSDTLKPSFIDPPQFSSRLRKAALKPEVVRFVAGIRDFFERAQDFYFHGRFELWRDTVDFYAIRDSLHFLLYRLSSVKSGGEPFIRGTVMVSELNGYAIYPWTELFLYKEGVGMILELKNLDIKKK